MAARQEIKLGVEVKCIVTGFAGTTTARIEYLNGCVRWLVTPKAQKDGKLGDEQWIDQQQLAVTKATTEAAKLAQRATGGPGAVPHGRPTPPRR